MENFNTEQYIKKRLKRAITYLEPLQPGFIKEYNHVLRTWSRFEALASRTARSAHATNLKSPRLKD